MWTGSLYRNRRMREGFPGPSDAANGPVPDLRCCRSTNNVKPSLPHMNIQEACPSDAPMIASVLEEAAQWLAGDGRALWTAAEIANERVLRDASAGLFHVAREGEQLAGVMKFELEDAHFWPEVPPGTSAFVHKLVVRRAWAKKGVSTECCHMPELERKNLDVLTCAWIASPTGKGCEDSMKTSASRCTASSR